MGVLKDGFVAGFMDSVLGVGGIICLVHVLVLETCLHTVYIHVHIFSVACLTLIYLMFEVHPVMSLFCLV